MRTSAWSSLLLASQPASQGGKKPGRGGRQARSGRHGQAGGHGQAGMGRRAWQAGMGRNRWPFRRADTLDSHSENSRSENPGSMNSELPVVRGLAKGCARVPPEFPHSFYVNRVQVAGRFPGCQGACTDQNDSSTLNQRIANQLKHQPYLVLPVEVRCYMSCFRCLVRNA